ncbi:1,2-phenylacetyl-CoA epoxidase subunit PaaD [Paraburkholderia denitrificans]|uniref:1,2-phenylacetyl-CoA epoxidase subunit PaaD n=1 Tax=Paraburkholderia denitrificans TaxID=694025 RepID=A0ABW0J7J0_9BURK
MQATRETKIEAKTDHALARAWEALESVPDPEIPVVSIRELGILRAVRRGVDGRIEVVITPTYSGCPAMSQIAGDVARALDGAGLAPYRIETALTPAWTTDWIGEAAREKLRAFGIAPPTGQCGSGAQALHEQPLTFVPPAAPVCPHCGSPHTARLAQFGSTACKALYRCNDCREPFDYFKPY